MEPALGRVQKDGLDLPGTRSEAPFVVGVVAALPPDLGDVGPELLGLLGRQPVRDLAGVVEASLLSGRELGDELLERRGVPLGHRFHEPGHHRPAGSHPRGVGRNVLADRGLGDLVVVDLLLDRSAEDVGDLDELDALKASRCFSLELAMNTWSRKRMQLSRLTVAFSEVASRYLKLSSGRLRRSLNSSSPRLASTSSP